MLERDVERLGETGVAIADGVQPGGAIPSRTGASSRVTVAIAACARGAPVEGWGVGFGVGVTGSETTEGGEGVEGEASALADELGAPSEVGDELGAVVDLGDGGVASSGVVNVRSAPKRRAPSAHWATSR